MDPMAEKCKREMMPKEKKHNSYLQLLNEEFVGLFAPFDSVVILFS